MNEKTKINIGDKVRIKTPIDWPSSLTYRFADAEGTVSKWVEYEEAMAEFQDYVFVNIEKADGEGQDYIGNSTFFRMDALEKI